MVKEPGKKFLSVGCTNLVLQIEVFNRFELDEEFARLNRTLSLYKTRLLGIECVDDPEIRFVQLELCSLHGKLGQLLSNKLPPISMFIVHHGFEFTKIVFLGAGRLNIVQWTAIV